MRFRHLASVLGLSLALANGAAAQQSAATASTPFHAGQWALQGDVGGQLGIGLLRFGSPTRALAVTVGGNVSRRTQEASPIGIPTIEVTRWSGALFTSLGVRQYHPLIPALAIFNTFGLSGNYQRFTEAYTLGGGPFVDLGGQYLLGEHFSVGVSSALGLNYVYSKFGGQAGTTDRVLTLQAGQTKVLATVYF